jgi:ketosteroid isomerase-like protein
MSQEFAQRYYQAYNDGDLDAILAEYAPDAEYRLHGADGVRTFRGVDACRAVYAAQLRAWPDQRLEPRSVLARDDLLVCEVTLTATLAEPWKFDRRTHQPSGRPISFDVMHVIRFRDGLLWIKDGWIDGLAIRNQLAGRA